MLSSAAELMNQLKGLYRGSVDFQDNTADTGEPKKVVVTTSTLTAVRRCLFHLIPIGTSVALISINLRGIFLGYDLSGATRSETINLMFLQLAAKAHEIFIVASLGLIILQTVRHQLLFGDGLPLGLVGSGLSFSDFSLIFRKEFYGSLKYLASHGNRTRKYAFVGLLIVSIFTAAFAGPSSAVLLVPHSQSWPSAATDIFLNGSVNDFWPSDLSSEMQELALLCNSEQATRLAICPGGGFISLREHWSRLNSSSFFEEGIPPYARLISGSSSFWPVLSPDGLIPPRYALGGGRDKPALKEKTTLVQPHAATAVILQQAAKDWWKSMTVQKNKDREAMDAYIDDRQVRAQVVSALATVRCGAAQDLAPSDKTLMFPSIPFWFEYGEPEALDVEDLSNVPSAHLHFQWAHLPGRFGPASIGGIFQTPWTQDNGTRLVIACTAQTGWVPTEVRTDSYSFWSGWYPWNITWGDRVPRYDAAPHDESLSPTNGRIALGDPWLKLLTPPAPVADSLVDGWQPSTIESILSDTALAYDNSTAGGNADPSLWAETQLPAQSRISFLEMIICSVLVDGISRTGSHRVFNKQGTPSQWNINSYEPLPKFSERILSGRNAFAAPTVPPAQLTTINMTMSITGFALRRSLSAYLAMAVLLTHATIAIVHIIWTLFSKHTSRSWSSVSELIALAQNSSPAFGALANTAAGVKCANTFAQLAKIRVRSHPGNAQQDHVELVFESDSNTTKRRPSGTRSSSSQQDPWSSLLVPNSNESDEVQRPRGSWTWPNDPRKLSVVQQENTELHGRSTSTERLIPRVHLADVEKGDIVRVNRAYG